VIEDAVADLTEVDAATARLLATAAELGDDDVRAPSMLPGWTRGHVLTHVARHAEAMLNLLRWARTGNVTPAYESQEHRDAGIEAGAGRTAEELHADVSASADRFHAAVLELPAEAWAREVRIFDRPPFPAAEVPLRRLVEVELHHVDLGLGYTPASWPASFAGRRLPQPLATFRADRVSWFSRPRGRRS
jgi:maleylpyruvate isomerase